MPNRTDQAPTRPSPTAPSPDESLAAWLAADDLYVEMARTRANAAARCSRANCPCRAVTA